MTDFGHIKLGALPEVVIPPEVEAILPAADEIGLWRRELNWSMTDLAHSLGITTRRLGRIERGEEAAPDILLQIRVAMARTNAPHATDAAVQWVRMFSRRGAVPDAALLDLALRVRAARGAEAFSTFARKLGVPPATLLMIERGEEVNQETRAKVERWLGGRS